MNRHAVERSRADKIIRACLREAHEALYPKVEWKDLLDAERQQVRRQGSQLAAPHLNRAAKRALGERGYQHGLGKLATSLKEKP